MPTIAVDGLTKRFGSVLAVDNLTFELPEGSITGPEKSRYGGLVSITDEQVRIAVAIELRGYDRYGRGTTSRKGRRWLESPVAVAKKYRHSGAVEGRREIGLAVAIQVRDRHGVLGTDR